MLDKVRTSSVEFEVYLVARPAVQAVYHWPPDPGPRQVEAEERARCRECGREVLEPLRTQVVPSNGKVLDA